MSSSGSSSSSEFNPNEFSFTSSAAAAEEEDSVEESEEGDEDETEIDDGESEQEQEETEEEHLARTSTQPAMASTHTTTRPTSGTPKSGGSTTSASSSFPDPRRCDSGVDQDGADDDDVSSLKAKGLRSMKHEHFNDAVHWYTQALMRDSDNPQLFQLRSAALMKMRRFQDAIADCLRALELDREFARVHSRLARAYFNLGDCDQALHQYSLALATEINPNLRSEMDLVDDCADYLAAFKITRNNREYEKALACAKYLMQAAPESVAYCIMYCEVLIESNRASEAAQILADLMHAEIVDDDVIYTRARALFYGGLSFLSQAIVQLQRLLHRNPSHERGQQLLYQCTRVEQLKTEGNGLFASRRWAEAGECYRKALEIDPKNFRLCAVLHCNRAAARKEEGKFADAVKDCDKAIQMDPNYEKAFLRRARCHVAMEMFEEAVRDFDCARRINPTSRETDRELHDARLRLRLKNQQQQFHQQQQQQARFAAGAGAGHQGPHPQNHNNTHHNTSNSNTNAAANITGNGGKNPYQVLGVPRDADEKQIKKAYREQALKLHPDKWAGGSDEEKASAEKQFKEVGEAYSILSDPIKRARYDQTTAYSGLKSGFYDFPSAADPFGASAAANGAADSSGYFFFRAAGVHKFYTGGGNGGKDYARAGRTGSTAAGPQYSYHA